MNVEWYMARRLLGEGKSSATSIPIVKIATAGIAMGLCVMLLAVFVTSGFKKEISGKLSGFMADANVLPGEGESIREGGRLVALLAGVEGVREAYGYVEKPAIFRSRGGEGTIHGVLARGLDATHDAAFFRQHLVEGVFPDFTGEATSDRVLVSTNVAGYLGAGVGDRVTAYFPDKPNRPRRFEVGGVYRTGFKEYDDAVVLVDKRHLLRLNGWGAGELSGVAVALEEAGGGARVDSLARGMGYEVRTLGEIAPGVFDWLELLDMNVWIILVLLVTVAGFNMASGLLILILDKSAMIGTLKALGCRDVSLQVLFLRVAAGLVGRGMLWGNALAGVLAGVQVCFEVVTLDAEVYYMSTVPLSVNAWDVLALNAGVMVVTVLMLVAPTFLASRADPVRSMKFE